MAELEDVKKEIEGYKARLADPERDKTLDKLLERNLAALREKEVLLMKKDQVTVVELLGEPLPKLGYLPPDSPPGTGKYPDPSCKVEVWENCEDTISAQLPDLLARLPNIKLSKATVPGLETQDSEAAVAARFQTILGEVEHGMKLAGSTSRWRMTPSKDKLGAKQASKSFPSAISSKNLPGPLEVEGLGSKPDFEMLGGSGKSFIEMKVPQLLLAAGTRSLAELLNTTPAAKRGRRPTGAVPSPIPRVVLLNVLGQVEEYCIERRARYFALSTYDVTWFGCIRDGRLLISRGFAWSAQGPSVREALFWMSFAASGPDGAFEITEVPPRPSSPSSTKADGVDGAGTGHGSEGTSSIKGADSVDHDGDTTSRAVLEWRVVPPSPGGGVLGYGISGDVLAGRLAGVPAAVKFGLAGSYAEDDLLEEARVYTRLELIQGIYTPRLLYAGPTSRGYFVLVTTRVFGRQLRRRGLDAQLLPQALAALRAVHALGYLHGDAGNLCNFLVEDEGQGEGEAHAAGGGCTVACAPRVFVLDFGHSMPCGSVEEQLAEERELCIALTGTVCVASTSTAAAAPIAAANPTLDTRAVASVVPSASLPCSAITAQGVMCRRAAGAQAVTGHWHSLLPRPCPTGIVGALPRRVNVAARSANNKPPFVRP